MHPNYSNAICVNFTQGHPQIIPCLVLRELSENLVEIFSCQSNEVHLYDKGLNLALVIGKKDLFLS